MVMVPILVDWREKLPYEFPGIPNHKVKETELETGDYSLEGFEDKFAVERKTLDDLATSLGTNRDRFEAEIQRAQDLDEFVVVIEADEEDVYAYRDQRKCPNYFSNIHPNSVIGTVEGWSDEKYDNLEFIWAGSRRGGMEETLRLLDKWYLSEVQSADSPES